MRARGPHHAIGLYAHLTWHTWRRESSIRRVDAAVVAEVVMEAARRCGVRVHAQAVLADHVHVLLSYSPDVTLSSFIRHAKSESARRINLGRSEAPSFRWARGFYAGSLSRSHVRAARVYLANQRLRHADRLPA
jgi:REP element-mobilizing transposase RayT